jgi:hypothetical protein
LITRLDQLASRPGHQLIYSVGWELSAREREAITLVPAHAWQIALDHRGQVRQRRANEACADRCCAHARCWIDQAHVTELTGLLRSGPAGDQLASWPPRMRVFARRERPHPGAQLTLFEAADGWRYCLWVTNLPTDLRGWQANPAYIDAAHRVHARVEDRIRTGKDCGIGRFPSHSLAINSAWLATALLAATLLAWLAQLALDGDLAKAEPKTIRYQILHASKSRPPGPGPSRSPPPGPGSPPCHRHPDQHQTTPTIKKGNLETVEPRPPGPPARPDVIPKT